jgi:putative peptidoglycan lipid II flippase
MTLPLASFPRLWVIWLTGFTYAFVVAVVLQKLVMPILPGLHAGHGLMNHDAIIFHNMAVAMADRILASGWGEWKLIPGNGITANVGILAAVYVVFGADPVWFIPLNAGFHSLGALLVLRLGMLFVPGKSGWIAGGVAAFLFLVFPSALVWYGQNHKDSFLIAGYLLVLVAFAQALGRTTWKGLLGDVVLLSMGCALVAIMRPHMLMIYILAIAFAIVAVAIWHFVRRSRATLLAFRNGLIMLGVAIAANSMSPTHHLLITSEISIDAPHRLGVDWHWDNTGVLPVVIENKLKQASFIRAHFYSAGKSVGAGSLIDGDMLPKNAFEMLAYLPRALWVGLFAPFPDTWMERPTLPRVIGAIETLIFYIAAAGILITLWRRPSLPLMICLVVSALVLILLSYTSPNLGTLHRIRYGPWFVFMLSGVCGWIWLLGKLTLLMQTAYVARDGGHASMPLAGQSASPVNIGGSGMRAVGAGVMVFLLSLIGAFGLFVRDLLLINRSGFGTSLDSFYLAMMIPMLLVGILALPLGDALVAALHQIKERKDVQSLLSGVSGASLLVFALVSLIVLAAASQIYRNFVANGDVSQVVILIPISVLLFMFSGLVVTGNSLLNSLGKSESVAVAQLVVPLVAVGAILVAPEIHLMVMATVGMVAGQVLNLAILYAIAGREGYHLRPTVPFRILPRFRGILVSYGLLIVAALLISLAIPLNYWFASQLGEGSVSTWAVGSKLVQIATALGIGLLSAVWMPYVSKLVTAGFHVRIRQDVFLTLIVGSWSGGVLLLMVFAFCGPILMAAMPEVQDAVRVGQLTSVVRLGALQLPLLVAALLLLKLSAASEVSWKVLLATLSGFIANVMLGNAWLPVWGLSGVAAAWSISTLVSTVVLIFTSRAQSYLGLWEIFSVVATWLVLCAAALAIYLESLLVAAGALLVFGLVLLIQTRILLRGNTESKAYTNKLAQDMRVFLKRLFDMFAAALALLLLAPALALIAWQVRRKLGSPVLFCQVRPGLYGKPFEMVKFRTMTDEHSADGVLLPDHQRLTPFGRFLRASSLDELPELWNVLKGEMSLVGPRPLLMEYLPLYTPEQARRHDVRPGITGWAQVNGRNAISWEDKFALDVWYVNHRSFLLDVRILWMTVKKVLVRDGITLVGEATTTKFKGTKT